MTTPETVRSTARREAVTVFLNAYVAATDPPGKREALDALWEAGREFGRKEREAKQDERQRD